MKECDNCKFSGVQLAPDKTINNICRRYPPKAQPIQMPSRDGITVQIATIWPGITDGDWCGEYVGKLSS